MSKIYLFPFLLALMLLCLLCIPASAEAPADAVAMTRLMGNGINLGNTMEACNNGVLGGNTTDDPVFYETYWGQPRTTAAIVQGMKEALSGAPSPKNLSMHCSRRSAVSIRFCRARSLFLIYCAPWTS